MRSKFMKALSTLFILLIASIIFVGCSNDATEETTGNGDEGNGNGANENEEASSGEVGYPESLSYWIALDANVAATSKNLNEVGVYKEIEKITGTKLDLKQPSGVCYQVSDMFNFMCNSIDIHDILDN